MRLSYRLGSLAALLLLSLFLLNHHLDHLPHGSRSPFWKSSRATTKPPDVYTHRKTKLKFPDSSLLRIQPSRETTEIIVPNDRIIVMARLSSEDTSWVSADLTEYVLPFRPQ